MHVAVPGDEIRAGTLRMTVLEPHQEREAVYFIESQPRTGVWGVFGEFEP